MLGAIAGDVIGSAYEASPVKTTDFELFPPGSRFTDDTVLTVATAEALLGDGDYAGAYRRYGRAYPQRGLRRQLLPLVAERGRRTLQQLGQRRGHAGKPGGLCPGYRR